MLSALRREVWSLVVVDVLLSFLLRSLEFQLLDDCAGSIAELFFTLFVILDVAWNANTLKGRAHGHPLREFFTFVALFVVWCSFSEFVIRPLALSLSCQFAGLLLLSIGIALSLKTLLA